MRVRKLFRMLLGKHPARFVMQHNTQSTAGLSTEGTAVGGC